MKFIGRVSTVNLADISSGGETKSGFSLTGWHSLSTETISAVASSFTLPFATLFYSWLVSLSFLFFPLPPFHVLLSVSAVECQLNDGKKKLKAAVEVIGTAARWTTKKWQVAKWGVEMGCKRVGRKGAR